MRNTRRSQRTQVCHADGKPEQRASIQRSPDLGLGWPKSTPDPSTGSSKQVVRRIPWIASISWSMVKVYQKIRTTPSSTPRHRRTLRKMLKQSSASGVSKQSNLRSSVPLSTDRSRSGDNTRPNDRTCRHRSAGFLFIL